MNTLTNFSLAIMVMGAIYFAGDTNPSTAVEIEPSQLVLAQADDMHKTPQQKNACENIDKIMRNANLGDFTALICTNLK